MVTDFLIVDDRYLIDFWFRYTTCEDKYAPIAIDMHTQKELLYKYYGDPNKWETLPN